MNLPAIIFTVTILVLSISGICFWAIILSEPVKNLIERCLLSRFYRPYQYEFKPGDVVLRDGYYWFVQSRSRWGKEKTYILKCMCKDVWDSREGNKIEIDEEKIRELAVQNEDTRW